VPDVSAARPAPSFDLVRADPDGSVLVAGTAGPGERVRIDLDGAEAAAGRADAQGGFVLFLDVPPDGRGRLLDLVAIGEDGAERRADGSVVIAPVVADAPDAAQAPPTEAAPGMAGAARAPAAPGEGAGDEPPARAAPDGAKVAAQAPQSEGESAEPAVSRAVAAPGEGASVARPEPSGRPPGRAVPPSEAPRRAPAAARAPAVLLADSGGVRLLQPSAPRPRSIDRVIVDVISYDATGAVLLEGRSAPPPPPAESVRIYLDGTAVDTAKIADDGTWRLPLADVESGVYTLRVDQLDPAGRVVSRFQTPFKREDPVALARLETGAAADPRQTPARARVITVQPGYTLWGIAADRYGSGFRYVHIFEANDDQIRDPDLIYPGQIFDLPEIEDDN
jgi:nucleoid-associated protein YgaU